MRRSLGFVCAFLIVLIGAVAPAAALYSRPTAPQPTTPTGAWALVDYDTGAVLDAANARTPMRPASTFKVMTALVASQLLPPDADVPVSARAAAMPASKINMQAGQIWTLSDALHCLLIVSANDAAAAIAERAGGSLEAFAEQMNRAAVHLHLEDGPVIQDPAGLDDSSSVGGGNLISARDLAIVTRALLAQPMLREIVATPVYRFHGGDNLDHRLLNHNQMLRTYPGAIGVKTGYTQRAGHTLIAAATRNGRTMVAVLLHSDDPYHTAAALLDKGFATPASAEAALDHLPAITAAVTPATPPPPAPTRKAPATTAPAHPKVVDNVAQGDDGPVPVPAHKAASTKVDVPRLGTFAAVFLLGVLPASWIVFVARPRSHRRKKAKGKHRSNSIPLPRLKTGSGKHQRKPRPPQRATPADVRGPSAARAEGADGSDMSGRGRPEPTMARERPPQAVSSSSRSEQSRPPRPGTRPAPPRDQWDELVVDERPTVSVSPRTRPAVAPSPRRSTASWPEAQRPPSRSDGTDPARVAR